MARAKRETIDGQPILIDRIEIPAGRRAADPKAVAALVESIKAVGLMNPIRLRRVDGLPTLVAGLHRIEAYKALGREAIPAVIVDATDDEAALAEIDENLCRSELSAAERANIIGRRRELWQRLHGPIVRKIPRVPVPKIHSSEEEFAEDTSGKTGKSKSTIRNAFRRARELGPLLDRIRGTSLDEPIELDALIKLSPEEREALVARAEKGEKVSARPPKPPKAPQPAPPREPPMVTTDRGPPAREPPAAPVPPSYSPPAKGGADDLAAAKAVIMALPWHKRAELIEWMREEGILK